MCGIFGVLTANETLPNEAAQRALSAIAHRGPDGHGIWRSATETPNVLLGHRRLAVIDLSEAAAQPMVAQGDDLVLVFNGEIYNFKELRDTLRKLGRVFHTESDTEVLIAAYRQWGRECVEHLNGMFAFVIWDLTKQRLFAARDRFGEKPFFFHYDQARKRFAFASEIKALMASGMVPFALNEEAMGRYVAYEAIDAEVATMIEGVSRLLPGERLTLSWTDSNWDLAVSRYWQLPTDRLDVSLDSAAEMFHDLLQDSVRLRLRADVPVGTSLSGGLDSSAIVCLIRNLGADAGQRTFSARMPDPRLDEGRYIKAVLDSVRVEGHEVTPTAARLRESFEKMCWYMEEPFPATSMFAQYLVMELAASQDTTVLLDGQGADELFAGYLRYYQVRMVELLRQGSLLTVWREFAAFKAKHGGHRPIGVRRLLATLMGSKARASTAWAPGLQDFGSWWSRDWRESRNLSSSSSPADSVEAALHRDSTAGPLQALLRYGDRNSMAWSREVRQPFLDHRLAEFACRLPTEYKVGGGDTKRVLRQGMRGVVPDVILDRHDKLGYQAPMGAWLGGELRAWTQEKLDSAFAVLGDRLDPQIVERFSALPETLHEWREGRHVMRLLTMAEGLRHLRDVAQQAGKGGAASGATLPLVNQQVPA